jgi:hypothetical protein
MAADVTCGSCGTALRDDAKFCDQCGVSTAAPIDAAQYKQVTVLFADVVGSMEIAEALELERYRELMTDLLDRSAMAVRRFGGTVESTGDGVMAIFGAPIALEDHALRACLAGLAIQDIAGQLALDVAAHDRLDLRVRVGLNSGRVIAGEIGSGSLGYGATGGTSGWHSAWNQWHPGFGDAFESTASLVETTATLADPEWVHIKGEDEPVRAYRLLAVNPRQGLIGRAQTRLIGRRREMATLDSIVNNASRPRRCRQRGGTPGIGKSRVAREAAMLATTLGAQVIWAFCESHARDVPFHAVTRLLRAGLNVTDLDDAAARAKVREQIPDSDPQDLLLLDDLLGIGDPDVPLPQIDPMPGGGG